MMKQKSLLLCLISHLSRDYLLFLLACFGLKTNLKKTKAVWIGTNKGYSAKPLHVHWVTGVKNLGIYFLGQKEEVTVQNFEERLNQICIDQI